MNWMTDNVEILGHKTINRIIVPATHDSGAYNIDYQNPTGGAKFRRLSRFINCCCCFQGLVNNWTKTQNMSIYTQLVSGIRFFDLRLSVDNNIFYVTHRFTCIYLERVFYDIIRFNQEHPNEIIFLTITFDYNHRQLNTEEVRDNLREYLRERIGHLLILNDNNNRYPSYNQVLATNKRICLYKTNVLPSSIQTWSRLNIPWIDTNNPDIKYIYLTDEYEKMSSNNSDYNVISFTVTPSARQIRNNIIKGLVLPCCLQRENIQSISDPIHDKLQLFIETYGVDKLSAIMFDYPTDELITAVIDLNGL